MSAGTERAAEVAALVEVGGLSVEEAHARLDAAKAHGEQSLDAVLATLPTGADWRRLTPMSMSVYAASPYNAAAQVRYDGYGDTPAEQLQDALTKMALAQAKARGAQ